MKKLKNQFMLCVFYIEETGYGFHLPKGKWINSH